MLSYGFSAVHVESTIGASEYTRKHASDIHNMVILCGHMGGRIIFPLPQPRDKRNVHVDAPPTQAGEAFHERNGHDSNQKMSSHATRHRSLIRSLAQRNHLSQRQRAATGTSRTMSPVCLRTPRMGSNPLAPMGGVGILRVCVCFWKSERFKNIIFRKYQDPTPVTTSQKYRHFSKLSKLKLGKFQISHFPIFQFPKYQFSNYSVKICKFSNM